VDPSILQQQHTNLCSSVNLKLRQHLPESFTTNACSERLQKQLQPLFSRVKINNENNKGIWLRVVDAVRGAANSVIKFFKNFV